MVRPVNRNLRGEDRIGSKEETMIEDGQQLVSAKYVPSGYSIHTYDEGFGPLWISRNSIGINGIVRARTWETAYNICEDEFFPEADETMEEIVKEYGFNREHRKVVKDSSVLVERKRRRIHARPKRGRRGQPEPE